MTMARWNRMGFKARMKWLRRQNPGDSEKMLALIASGGRVNVQVDPPERYYPALARFRGDPEAVVGSRRQAREVAERHNLVLL